VESPVAEAETTPKAKRSWRTWHLLVGVGAAFLIGAGIGAAGTVQANSERDDALERAEAAEERADTAEGEIADANERADNAEAEAREQAESDLADETAALDQRATEMDTRQADLDAQEADLAAREAQLNATLNGLQASQFTDGIYQVGRDIQPGTYHTDGSGDSCYFALLGADGQDIIDNNIVNGPVTTTINSPYFESNGCGTWTKVG
jgi:hypothetical protein